MKYLLHAGCGPRGTKVPREFAAYKEIRLDVDPTVEPDFIGSIVAMPMILSEQYDAIFCAHCLEHLYAHEVPMALAEFYRILVPDGTVDIRVPDLQGIGGRIGLGEIDQPIYQSSAGPVTPLDMLYGLRSAVANGHYAMAHTTGFTAGLLKRKLQAAGFQDVEVIRGLDLELKATARKGVIQDAGEVGSPAEIPQRSLRARMGEAAPLR